MLLTGSDAVMALSDDQVTAAKAWRPLIDWAGPREHADAPEGERGGYRARFRGGVVDGREFRVPSLAPTRLARHDLDYDRPGFFPQAQRTAKPPPGVMDAYDAGAVDGDVVVYAFRRTIRRAG